MTEETVVEVADEDVKEEKPKTTRKKKEEPKIDETPTTATEDVAVILLDEAKKGYREWDYEDQKYTTRFPTAEEEAKAGWTYSRTFNQALKEDLPTKKEMSKILIDRGILDEAQEIELAKKRERILELEELLSKLDPGVIDDTSRGIVTELLVLRSEVMDAVNETEAYMQNTVEAKAEEAKSAFLISRTTLKDGKRVWATTDEFLTDTNRRLVNVSTYQYTTFSLGVYENYFEALPEIQYLRSGKFDEAGD